MNLKSSLLESNHHSIRVLHDDAKAVQLLSQYLLTLLPSPLKKPIVVVCIGTDRSTGDSLGPLVGTKLLEKSPSHFHIYGTLEEPIHAINLKDTIKHIYRLHQNPFVIGIDACLGKLKNVGTISAGTGPVKPGAGVNKSLPPVGDIHMTGIVNISGFMEYFVLQNTRLYLVMRMADLIAESIVQASCQLSKDQKNPSFLYELDKA